MVATQPESGTLTYTYDANGNLETRADARRLQDRVTPLTCSYSYDALNRVLTRSYNDGTAAQNFSDHTPTVTYSYDTLPQRKGHLTAVSSSVSSYHYTSYDAVGRVTSSSQVTEGQTYQMSYRYNLAGQLTSQTYPSERVVTTEYDAAGRVAGVKPELSGSYYAGGAATDPVTRLQYTAHGAVAALRLSNGLWEHTTFNSRLQPTQIGLGTLSTNSTILQLDYSYGVLVNDVLDQTQNSGNVQGQTLTLPGGVSLAQSYEYDPLNRLKLAQENNGASWKQVYAYDPYGNRTFAAGTTIPALPPEVTDPAVNPAISAATNRISDGQGYGYDAAGNLTALSGKTLTYDGENRQVSANVGGEYGLTQYRYDGDGRRVKKVTGSGTTTIFVYNVLGQLVAEYSTASPAPAGGTSYLTADHLGTPRVITNADGGVQARHDYLPFGEELGADIGGRTTNQGYSQLDGMRQQFTGKERDIETGLDYFGARYFASTHGRFTSPDDFLNDTHTEDPSSWNLYAYVRNNPLTYVDPNGKEIWISWFEQGADGKFIYNRLQYKGGKLYGADGKEYRGNNADALKALKGLNELKSLDDVARAKITTLERSKHSHEILLKAAIIGDGIRYDDLTGSVTPGVGSNSVIEWDPNRETDTAHGSAIVSLAHEISHAYDADRGIRLGEERKTSNDIELDEVKAVKFENRIRDRLGEPLRFTYNLEPIPPQYFSDQPPRLRPAVKLTPKTSRKP